MDVTAYDEAKVGTEETWDNLKNTRSNSTRGSLINVVRLVREWRWGNTIFECQNLIYGESFQSLSLLLETTNVDQGSFENNRD